MRVSILSVIIRVSIINKFSIMKLQARACIIMMYVAFQYDNYVNHLTVIVDGIR